MSLVYLKLYQRITYIPGTVVWLKNSMSHSDDFVYTLLENCAGKIHKCYSGAVTTQDGCSLVKLNPYIIG
jgi:hypothetical protein